MTEHERALAEATDWQASEPELAGLVPHVVPYSGYWWASFRTPGLDGPMLGGVSLLIDLGRGVVLAGTASIPPDQRVATYEASFR